MMRSSCSSSPSLPVVVLSRSRPGIGGGVSLSLDPSRKQAPSCKIPPTSRKRKSKSTLWSILTCCMPFDDGLRASQSFTSHHQAHYQQPAPQLQSSRSRASFTTPTTLKSEFNPALMFDPSYRKSRMSELGIAGIGIERPEAPGTALQRTKSLWNVTNEDYWNRAPPSRPVSMGYVNHVLSLNMDNAYNSPNMGTINNNYRNSKGSYLASLDNRKSWMMNMGRKAASMDGLNHFYRYYGQNIIANNNFTSNWSKSSLEFDSDDI